MIQDTSFIIDLLRGDNDAVDKLDDLETNRIPQKCSSITVLELYEGIYQFEDITQERKTVLEVLDSKHIVNADQDLMKKAGKISGELLRKGEEIDREDCVIAATALQEDEPILTRNTDHFRRVDNVTVETY